LHQVGDLFELNLKLRCQKVNLPHTQLTVKNLMHEKQQDIMDF